MQNCIFNFSSDGLSPCSCQGSSPVICQPMCRPTFPAPPCSWWVSAAQSSRRFYGPGSDGSQTPFSSCLQDRGGEPLGCSCCPQSELSPSMSGLHHALAEDGAPGRAGLVWHMQLRTSGLLSWMPSAHLALSSSFSLISSP